MNLVLSFSSTHIFIYLHLPLLTHLHDALHLSCVCLPQRLNVSWQSPGQLRPEKARHLAQGIIASHPTFRPQDSQSLSTTTLPCQALWLRASEHHSFYCLCHLYHEFWHTLAGLEASINFFLYLLSIHFLGLPIEHISCSSLHRPDTLHGGERKCVEEDLVSHE